MNSVPSLPIVRKRARKEKVKTGCQTCKKRHLKCDEARPVCLRCTQSRRKCDGYKMPGNAALGPSSSNVSPDPTTRLPSLACMDAQERRAFQFFCTKTASEITGFLPSDFWTRLIPQACCQENAILHAAIALGSAHESFEGNNAIQCGSGASTQQQFTLQQYNKAIKNLLMQPVNDMPQSGESVLLVCILFICLETLQSNHEAALAHLESGLKLLGHWLNDDHQPVPISDRISRPSRQFLDELVPLFTRLDVQATTYVTSRSLKNLNVHASTKTPFISPRFTSLRDANNQLADLVHWMLYSNNGAHNMMYWMVNNPMAQSYFRPPSMTCSNSIPKIPDVVQKKIWKIETQHGKLLQQWLNTLYLFLKENPNLDARDLRGAAMLKILYTSTTIIKAASLYNHDLEYDKYIADFERVVTLSEFLVKSELAGTKNNRPLYSFEMNILPPLHYCSTRCRDPKIRRKALALLDESQRREGMWDSAMLAAIARYVIQKEEAGLQDISSAEDILPERRICILDRVPVWEERRCVVKYCKGVRNPYAKLDIMEVSIMW